MVKSGHEADEAVMVLRWRRREHLEKFLHIKKFL